MTNQSTEKATRLDVSARRGRVESNSKYVASPSNQQTSRETRETRDKDAAAESKQPLVRGNQIGPSSRAASNNNTLVGTTLSIGERETSVNRSRAATRRASRSGIHLISSGDLSSGAFRALSPSAILEGSSVLSCATLYFSAARFLALSGDASQRGGLETSSHAAPQYSTAAAVVSSSPPSVRPTPLTIAEAEPSSSGAFVSVTKPSVVTTTVISPRAREREPQSSSAPAAAAVVAVDFQSESTILLPGAAGNQQSSSPATSAS